jgi:5-(carboxyamino)imidazole ribonucleotide mutase
LSSKEIKHLIDGWDSVLSILQMPGGVPVEARCKRFHKNAGILAAQIIGSHDKGIMDKMIAYKFLKRSRL